MQETGQVLLGQLQSAARRVRVKTSQIDSILTVSHPYLQRILSGGGKVPLVWQAEARTAGSSQTEMFVKTCAQNPVK